MSFSSAAESVPWPSAGTKAPPLPKWSSTCAAWCECVNLFPAASVTETRPPDATGAMPGDRWSAACVPATCPRPCVGSTALSAIDMPPFLKWSWLRPAAAWATPLITEPLALIITSLPPHAIPLFWKWSVETLDAWSWCAWASTAPPTERIPLSAESLRLNPLFRKWSSLALCADECFRLLSWAPFTDSIPAEPEARMSIDPP
mmetsp:Transcript_61806/g.137731  ORF Transcript_61806/g.137731 Transcript_61806/m.137731 type:complete len:203 (+) Transcript_61806:695-1303(+)